MRGATLLCLLLLSSTAGCGDDDDDTTGDGDADSDADADGDADGDADACVSDPASVDLTGVWGIQATLQVRLTERSDAIVHLCPDGVSQAAATLYLRLDVTNQAGDGTLDQTVSVCDIQLPAPAGAVAPCADDTPTVSIAIAPGAELADLLPSITFDSHAQLGMQAGCATYLPDDLVLVLGTDFQDRDTTLPAWTAGCAGEPSACVSDFDRVVDQDEDGNPGVTLTAVSDILGGEAYVTFRTVPTLVGTLRDDSTVVGTVDPELEYAIVGSDIALGELPLDTPTVIDNLPLIEPLAQGSTFVALRADDWGDGTCAAILDRRADFDR